MNTDEDFDLPTPILPPRPPEYRDESFLFNENDINYRHRPFQFQRSTEDREQEVSENIHNYMAKCIFYT